MRSENEIKDMLNLRKQQLQIANKKDKLLLKQMISDFEWILEIEEDD